MSSTAPCKPQYGMAIFVPLFHLPTPLGPTLRMMFGQLDAHVYILPPPMILCS